MAEEVKYTPTILDSYFTPSNIKYDGSVLAKRGTLELLGGGVTAEDDPVNKVTKITISGGAAGDGPQIPNNGTGTQNNIPSTSSGTNASTIRFSGANPSVTGILNGAGGRRLILHATGGPLVLQNENAGSDAANRIITGTGADLTVNDERSALLAYDSTSSRWRVVAISGEVPLTIGGANKDLLYRESATALGPIGTGIWTRESSGRINATDDGALTYGPADGTYPAIGLLRIAEELNGGEGATPIIAGRPNETNAAFLSVGFGWEVGDLDAQLALVGSTMDVSTAGSMAFSANSGSNDFLVSADTASFSNAVKAAILKSADSNIATTGFVRTVSSATPHWVNRNSANTADEGVIEITPSTETLVLWNTNAASGGVVIKLPGAAAMSVEDASIWRYVVSNSDFGMALPLGGLAVGSLPFRWKLATITQSNTSDTTLSAAQFSAVILKTSGTPGGPFNWILPNVTGAFYLIKNSSGATMTLKKSGGTGCAVATNTTRLIYHDGTDYVLGNS